jgi:hypothetical protein
LSVLLEGCGKPDSFDSSYNWAQNEGEAIAPLSCRTSKPIPSTWWSLFGVVIIVIVVIPQRNNSIDIGY